MSIYLPNEDNRPRLICMHCKTEQLIDIKPFTSDMTKIAEYTCKNCRKKFYAGILLLANSNLHSLMQNIQDAVNGVNAKNYLEVGDQGKAN